MKILSTKTPFLLVLFLAFLSTVPLHATDFFVDTSIGLGQVGGYYGPYMPADDVPLGYPLTIPPDNDLTFQNYFLGRTTAPTLSDPTTPERRAFFMFDMASLSIPAGEAITSVAIDLEVLFGGVLANFTGGVEFVEFTSTFFTAPEILDPDSFSLDPVLIWDSFGTGTPYGGFDFFPDTSPTPTIPGKYTIPLPGSLGDVTTAIDTGEVFIVTARLVSFDPDPIGSTAPPAVDPYEFVFGLTDVVAGGFPTTVDAPELIITTTPVIPEPSSLIVCLGLCGLSLVCRRVR